MKYLPTIARILLGLAFTVFGLNFFFHFIPQPPMPPAAGAFAGAMFATGYIFHLLKVLEVASGLALLSGRFVPLALAVLAPIIVNILFFHAFLAPSGLLIPLVLLVLELFLAWCYRDAFRPMLNPNAKPTM
jgi:putative oxidoreductase